MELNNIHLPASVIADLYRSSLIDTNPDANETVLKTAPVSAPVPGQWKYIGDNKKNILIAVSYSDVVHLPDEELSFLTGMLTACKLSLADVAIVNLINYKEKTYKEIIGYFKSRIVFLFGTNPVDFGLPVSFPNFQLQPFANATFLFTPELKEVKNDELLKSKLWVCLRRIFAI
jgi:hypothetical protein